MTENKEENRDSWEIQILILKPSDTNHSNMIKKLAGTNGDYQQRNWNHKNESNGK